MCCDLNGVFWGEKLVRYRWELDEVLSLIGKLRKVIKPRRIFLRRKIETAHSVQRRDFWVRLNGVFPWWSGSCHSWKFGTLCDVIGPRILFE